MGLNISFGDQGGYGRRNTHDTGGQLMEYVSRHRQCRQTNNHLRETHRLAGTPVRNGERMNCLPGTPQALQACCQ